MVRYAGITMAHAPQRDNEENEYWESSQFIA